MTAPVRLGEALPDALLEVSIAQAAALAGRTRAEILEAFRGGEIRGRIKRTTGGHVYAYRLDPTSLRDWVSRQHALHAQDRAIGALR